MKKKWILLFALATSFVVTAFKIADDIITRLGMQQQTAQWHIIRNFIGRFDSGPMEQGTEDGPANSVYKQLQSFRIPTAKLLPSIISGDKAGAARELCDYIKNYVNSKEFAEEYAKLRDDAMPLNDQGMSLASLKRNSEVFRINIKNYPNDTKYVAEQQKQLDENEKKIAAMQEAAKKPFPGRDIWEKTYPANPIPLIKNRLQEYLQLSATVDFNAKLTGTGKRQTFVNPVYEKKSLKWKAIYRAGKEVNDVITAFVKEWLKGEIISTNKIKMTAQNGTTAPAASNKTAATNPPAGAVEVAPPTATTVEKDQTSKPKKTLFNKLKEKTNTAIGN